VVHVTNGKRSRLACARGSMKTVLMVLFPVALGVLSLYAYFTMRAAHETELASLRSKLDLQESEFKRESELRKKKEELLYEANKRLTEFENRGNVIYTLTASIAIDVEPNNLITNANYQNIRLGTVIYLVHKNGMELRLTNREQTLKVESTEQGRMRLHFLYTPEDQKSFYQKQIDYLADFTVLRVRYGPVLNAVGLKIINGNSSLSYSVAINNVNVVRQESRRPVNGKLHARFDEGGQARACSLLYPPFHYRPKRENRQSI